ncbi:hypothetical protein IL306_010153 [Fusarium sp. DS 682]|nr:hypothetical protein IL306_010153 [Fusarium sp. DS 682]
MLVASPLDERILREREIKVEREPLPTELYGFLELPTNDDTWHTYVVCQDAQKVEPSLWDFPSVHVVGFLSDSNVVVAVASCIQQRFHDVYGQHLSPEVQAGEDVFPDVLKPTTDEIEKYGLDAAKEKTRSDVLRRAVRGVTCPGRLALYRYYKEIITDKCNLLPIEWAKLGYDLRVSTLSVEWFYY